MKTTISSVLTALLLLTARTLLAQLSGSYTVGTGGDYATLTAAIAALNANGVSGPVTFNLINTTYTETFPITINQFTGGSSTNRVTIKPAVGNTVTIIGSSTTSILRLNGADFVTIEGSNNSTTTRDLTITNTNTAAGTAGIWLSSLGAGQGATDNIIRNCIITGGGTLTSNRHGIIASAATIGLAAQGADNDNLTIQNNQIVGWGVAVQAYGTAASSAGGLDNLLITGNEIGGNTTATRIVFRGVSIGGVASTAPAQIVNNVIRSTDIDFSGNLAGIELGANSGNTSVSRNLIRDFNNTNTGGWGASGIFVSSSTGTNNITFVNNVIMNLNGTGWSNNTDNAYGFRITGGTGHNIFFNSVSILATPTNSSSRNAGVIVTAGSANIRNNAFFVRTAGIGIGAYGIIFGTGTLGTISNNIYYTTGTAAERFAGRNLTTSTNLSTIPGDAASLTVDPIFVDSSNNLRPFPTSPALLAGTPLSGITIDYLGVTRNASTPTIGAYEEGVDPIPPTITYSPLTNTASTSNRVLTNFATITDLSGVNTTSGTRPRIYYKKSTDPNTVTGWQFTEATNAASPFSFTIDYSLIGGVSVGDVIQYFVVAQDLAPTPNVGINSGTFASTPSSVALTAAAFPITGTINSYSINPALPTSMTVGTGGDYPTLTGAGGLFQDINNNVLGGNTTVTIISDLTEDGTHALQEAGLDGFTLTIQPSGNRIVSGSVAGAMIDFNGADGVTINGLNSGGNSLTIRNTSTNANATTIRFRNDATNNTITNCTVEGSTTNTNFPPTAATIFIGGGISTGNDNITISNCLISPSTSGRPTESIVSNGTSASIANDAITISNCQIHNFDEDGIYFVGTGNGNNHTITNNSLYDTAPGTAGAQYGIYIEGTTSGNTITGNFIGGSAPNASGMWSNTSTTQIFGLFVGNGSSNTVSNNTVQNFTLTASGTSSPFVGILVGSAPGSSTVNSNTVQNITINGTNTIAAVAVQTQGSGNLTVNNNTINNITRSAGAAALIGYASVSTGTTTMNGNTVQNLTQNTAAGLVGISVGGANATMTSSTVQSLSHAAGGALQGIAVSATGTVTVSNSTVQSLLHTGNAAASGIVSSGTVTSHTFNNNLVRAISNTNTGTSALVRGISSTAVGTLNITNNQVRNLTAATGATGTSPSTVALGGIITNAANLTQTITDNTVDTLTATNTTAAVQINGIGIQSSGSGGTIARNYIYRLSAPSSTGTPVIDGINVWDANNWTVANNVVSITNGTGTNAVTIRGLRSDATSGTINFFYNSVFIGGSATAGTAQSFAFNRTLAGTSTINLRNNSLFNARTGGTGAHLAISRETGGTFTSNHNVIFASANPTQQAGTPAVTDFAGWQTATGGDANSINSNPQYHSPLNLVPLPGSPNNDAGTPIAVTTDILSATRSATTPDIGAFEFTGATPTASGTASAPTWGAIPGAFLTINSGPTSPPSASVTAQFFNTGRTGTLPGVTNQAQEYWAVGSNVVGSFDVTFDLSGVAGVGDVNTIKLFRRSSPFTSWEDISSLIYSRQTSPNRLSVVLASGFSEFSLGGEGDNPLPVNLSTFTGRNIAQGVELRWQTASETDNAGFEVRRTEVINNVEQEWLTIASYRSTPSLAGQGTTSQAHNYTYTDAGVQVGKTYRYALRSVDLNGTVHDYPQTVTVEVTRLAPKVYTYKLEQNYPNPFNPSTRIVYQIAATSNVNLEVFDMLGRKVATLVNERKEAGEYSVNFNASGLSSGVYFYRLQTDKFTQTKKLMLVK